MDGIDIRIAEKPSDLSWESLHEFLWTAHAGNRAQGIHMRFPSLSGAEIRDRVLENGKMFVAFCGTELVGMAAVILKQRKTWWGRRRLCAHLCFDAVHSDYRRHGVLDALVSAREQYAHAQGARLFYLDTHERNESRIRAGVKEGYKAVGYCFFKDHFSVVMAKWPEGCPFSEEYILFRFCLSRVKSFFQALFTRDAAIRQTLMKTFFLYRNQRKSQLTAK